MLDTVLHKDPYLGGVWGEVMHDPTKTGDVRTIQHIVSWTDHNFPGATLITAWQPRIIVQMCKCCVGGYE